MGKPASPGKNVKILPAGGVTGFICRSAVDGKAFFRVYESGGAFVDYRLGHDDLEVTISTESQASFYQAADENVLDYALEPTVTGY
jgi:hypothetical protein